MIIRFIGPDGQIYEANNDNLSDKTSLVIQVAGIGGKFKIVIEEAGVELYSINVTFPKDDANTVLDLIEGSLRAVQFKKM